jgi:hypothetical protein
VNVVLPSLRRSRSDPFGIHRWGNLAPFRPFVKSLPLKKLRVFQEVDLLNLSAVAGHSPSGSSSKGPHFSHESLLKDEVHRPVSESVG